MQVVDTNDWDSEVEQLMELNKNYNIVKVVCILIKCICYITTLVCIILVPVQEICKFNNEEICFVLGAIAMIISRHINIYQSRIHAYELKNLVFCIIDEKSFIDSVYIKETSQVKITFHDFKNNSIEVFYVDCDVKQDSELKEDQLIVYPNNSILYLSDMDERKGEW